MMTPCESLQQLESSSQTGRVWFEILVSVLVAFYCWISPKPSKPLEASIGQKPECCPSSDKQTYTLLRPTMSGTENLKRAASPHPEQRPSKVQATADGDVTQELVATSSVAPTSTLLIKRLNENARIPTRGSALAAGYDLYRSVGTSKVWSTV